MPRTKTYIGDEAITAFYNFLKAATQGNRKSCVIAGFRFAENKELALAGMEPSRVHDLLSRTATDATRSLEGCEMVMINAHNDQETWHVTYHVAARLLTFVGE